MMQKKSIRIAVPMVASLTAVALMPAISHGAGFEKALIWSAKNAGMGGAVTSFVGGAEATVFNPAGLAGAANEVSGSFGPAFSTFKAPITSTTPVESKSQMSPLFGVTGSYKINDKLGVGVGVQTVGGSNVLYENFQSTLDLESKLSMVEISGGAGYEVTDGLKLGATYRATLVSATLRQNNLANQAALSDMKNTNLGGFRVGLQYAPKGSSWGVGAVYRNEISATGEGDFALTSAAGASLATGTSTVVAKLPSAFQLGGFYDFSSDLRVALDYSMTMYSAMSTLTTTTTISGVTSTLNSTINWKDQSQVRLGGQYRLNDTYTVRGGYVYTTQVTASDRASPTMLPPGVGHSFIAGAGMKISDALGVDVAGEYAQTKGDGSTAPGGTTGTYTASAFTAYAGVTYGF